jgi:hypothetical protein
MHNNDRKQTTYSINGLHDKTWQVEKELGSFEYTEGRTELLCLGGRLEDWEEDLIRLLASLWERNW